jgi:hypothetical protein
VRLTKRAWNNVLIFACLAMIIIFNTMTDKLVDNAEGESALILPPGSMILTLEYPDGTIERLGRNWLVTLKNESELSSDQQGQGRTQAQVQDIAQQLIDRWLMLTAQVKLTTSDETGYRVVIWLAGEQQSRRFWIQPSVGLITDILSQTTWQLELEQISQLNLESKVVL